MQVRLLEGRYQDGDAFAQLPGDVITVSEAEGKRLIEAGSAEPVAVKPVQRRETRDAAASR